MNIRNFILVLAAAGVLAAQSGDPDVLLQRAIRKESVEGDLKGAIDLYTKVIAGAAKNRAAAAKALLRLGECYEKQGNAEAQRAYERLVNEFSDQKEQARDAEGRLAAMGQTAAGSKNMMAQLIARGRDLGLNGRVTPDGKLCPFIDPVTGDLAVRDLRTGAVRRLTNEGTGAQYNDVHGSSPIPSRNGKQIAFTWYRARDQRELRVINMDGSGMRTVPVRTKGGDFYDVSDWSPDGKSVLVDWYVREPYFYGFVMIDVGTGEVHQIARSDGDDIAGFSPDGRWIVYSRQLGYQDPDWDIFALDTQTGHEAVVVTGTGADRKPMWVPDTDTIVFRSDRNGKNAIWMVRFQDGQAAGAPVLIKSDAGDYNPQGISRDGSLFYGLSHESTDVYQATVDPQTLRVQDTPTRLIETYMGHNSMPLWSPSGNSFAYYSERDSKSWLVVHHPDGKETMMAERTWSYPHWCGGGDRLTSWGTPKPYQVQLFDAKTGAASPAEEIKGLRAPYQLGFSPDCKAAYVSTYSRDTKQRRIYRYDISTGKETNLLTDAGDWSIDPRVSPNGRWLALRGNLPGGKGWGVCLVSTAGGPLRMLDESVPISVRDDSEAAIRWTPDSKRLIYVKTVKPANGRGAENEMYWISVDGGTPQSMGIRMPGATSPSLNADGTRILFSAATESSNELWVLRNLPLNQGSAEPVRNASAPRVLTKARPRDLFGRIMPDGNQILWVDSDTGDIQLRDIRTGVVRRLTHDGKRGQTNVFVGYPLASRDGKQIAFPWPTGAEKAELRVMNAAGSGMRKVPVGPLEAIPIVDWSPDGKSILSDNLQEGNGGWYGVATIHLATGEIHRLISCADKSSNSKCPGPSGGSGGIAGFSPDGKWIVYGRRVKPPQGSFGIYAMNLETGVENALVQGSDSNRRPHWIPGTNKILFQSYRNGKNGFWMIRFQAGWSAGSPVLVRHDVGDQPGDQGMSGDGSLFYITPSPKRDVYQATVDPQTLRVQGAPALAVKSFEGYNTEPVWSLQDDTMAYFSKRDGSKMDDPWRLVIRHPDGKEVLPTRSVSQNRLQWCPDGKQVFLPFTGLFDALTGAWTSLRGTDGRTLPAPGAIVPDCRTAYFLSADEPGHRGIFRAETGTGKETLLHREPITSGWRSNVFASPDGRWLAYQSQPPGATHPGLYLLSTAGGEPRLLDDTVNGVAVWAGISWSPDSKRLLYTRYKISAEMEMFWISIDGGGPQPMGLGMVGATGPSLNRDGKRIVFSAGEDKAELWVLPNLAQN